MKLRTKLTLLFACLLLVMAGVLLMALRLVSGIAARNTAKSTLESAMAGYADKIEYEDGRLTAIKNRSYDEGAYMQVFSADGSELLSGTDVFGIAGRMPTLLQEQEAGQVFRLDTGEENVYCCFLWKEESRKNRGRRTGQGAAGKTDSGGKPGRLAGSGDAAYGEPAGLAEQAGSTESIETAAPVEPAELTGTIKSAEAAGRIEPAESAGTIESAEAAGPAKRTESAESVETADPAETTESASGMAAGEMRKKRAGQDETGGVWIVGVLPEDSMENVMASVEKLAWIGLPLIVLLAALGGWAVTGRSLRPLQKITESAREISDGHDLSRRIALSPGRDEVHELADTFNDMMGRLERSFEAEQQFTSDASHELRTPTAVILAECEMAEKIPEDAGAAQESIREIHRQAKKMSELIGKLLSYTRLEQGTRRIEREEIDLSELVEDVCEEQRTVAGRGITIESEIEPGVAVNGDAALLISLVQNLVTNAVKYGKENGHVFVRVFREERDTAMLSDNETDRKRGQDTRMNRAQKINACVLVRDDGIGIRKEDLERIWNRFYQADRSRSDEARGVGLGLSLAQQIARLHGGTITAESTPGEGSSFLFTMPARGGP